MLITFMHFVLCISELAGPKRNRVIEFLEQKAKSALCTQPQAEYPPNSRVASIEL